jgi:hypothetical protein
MVTVVTPMFYAQLSRLDSDNTVAANSSATPEVKTADSIPNGYLQAAHFRIAPYRIRLAQYSTLAVHKAKPHVLKGNLKLGQVRVLFH